MLIVCGICCSAMLAFPCKSSSHLFQYPPNYIFTIPAACWLLCWMYAKKICKHTYITGDFCSEVHVQIHFKITGPSMMCLCVTCCNYLKKYWWKLGKSTILLSFKNGINNEFWVQFPSNAWKIGTTHEILNNSEITCFPSLWTIMKSSESKLYHLRVDVKLEYCTRLLTIFGVEIQEAGTDIWEDAWLWTWLKDRWVQLEFWSIEHAVQHNILLRSKISGLLWYFSNFSKSGNTSQITFVESWNKSE